jgi:Mrp family chromosome partitioning ATPase
MSKHFELFDRIDRERDLLRSVDRRALRDDAHPALPIDEASQNELEKLVNRLYLVPSPPPRVVVFTSLEPRSGCSQVCAHAADLLASRVNGSVCLVDANLHAPSLHSLFGVPNQRGLTDILADAARDMDTVTSQVPGGLLWLMTSGSPVQDCELLGRSGGLSARLAELRSRFDFVFIDAPSTSVSRAALALGRLADGVVVLLQANSTRREAARRMKEELEENNIRVLGAILYGRTFPIPEAIYKRL